MCGVKAFVIISKPNPRLTNNCENERIQSFFFFNVRGTKMRIEESRPKERKQSILEKREFVLKSTLPLKEVSWGGRSLRGNDLKY